jgi:hypothetical protein
MVLSEAVEYLGRNKMSGRALISYIIPTEPLDLESGHGRSHQRLSQQLVID